MVNSMMRELTPGMAEARCMKTRDEVLAFFEDVGVEIIGAPTEPILYLVDQLAKRTLEIASKQRRKLCVKPMLTWLKKGRKN
jgi:hypothetical protein